MNKNSKVLAAVIVLVIIIGGAYAIFHKSSKPASTAASTTNNSAATSSDVVVTKTSSSLGQYLAEPSGAALYIYGGDSAGVSNCIGACLSNWPAYQDKGSTSGLPANVSTITRSDNGETQFTYNGMPLYTFVGDSGGQVSGKGVSNFSVAKPVAASTPSSSSSSSTTPSSQSTTNSSSNYNANNY